MRRSAENKLRVVAVRIDPVIEQRLRVLAEATGRKQSFFLQRMIEEGIEAMDAEHTAGVQAGYEFDQQIRDAGARANSSAVELERVTARIAANTDRVTELTGRMEAGTQELEQAREQLGEIAARVAG